MAVPLDAGMPDSLDLGPGFTLRVTALSAVDGSVVSGVNVSSWSVLAVDVAGDGGASLETGPFMLVPGPQSPGTNP